MNIQFSNNLITTQDIFTSIPAIGTAISRNGFCEKKVCHEFYQAISGGNQFILMLEIFLLIVVGLYIIQKVSDR